MQHIDLDLADPVDQLALDETLLSSADLGRIGESVRTWELRTPTVVLGRSSPVDTEVDREYCQQQGIAILRRSSGGASIVGGPGCLMYSVVLSLNQRPELRKIDVAHRFVIQKVLAVLQRQIPAAEFQGTSDLTWNNHKFSGNSLKIAREHLLYHGTILYQADLDLIGRCLQLAPRQPAYRDGRGHREFVDNVPIDPRQFAADVADVFGASAPTTDAAIIAMLREGIRQLRQDRYDNPAWHFRH